MGSRRPAPCAYVKLATLFLKLAGAAPPGVQTPESFLHPPDYAVAGNARKNVGFLPDEIPEALAQTGSVAIL